jgi:uncharacterized membrane protein
MGINRYVKTLILSLIILAFAFSNPLMATENPEDTEIPIEYIKGTVVEIIEEEHDRDLGAGNLIDYQKVKVQITSGQFKDRIVTVENYTTGNPAYDIWVKQGDKVLLVLEILAGDIFTSYIADFQRDTYIYLLTALFVLLIILIGHKQGLKAVITLGITLLLIGKFMLPLLFKGYSPVLLAIFTGVLVTAITVVAIGGFTKKSLAAVLGTSGGLVAAAGIAILVGILANLSGLSNEEAQMLMFIPQETQYDFRGLLFAGIIIGALGAVMDVSMSIASAMDEVQKVGSKMTFKKLFKSGMNVGKDIMGTMCNTLILAYTGTSIPLLLLFMAYQQPFIKIINLDFLATEMVRALSGSIGLILSIPITAVISAVLMAKHNTNTEE